MAENRGESFDYVIVGGGLAGCVLAARLSEDPRSTVLLLEAGRDNDYEESYFATGAHSMWEGETNWAFETVPQQHLRMHKVAHPRGRLIGGSAAINVGSWSRGISQDYDAWEAAGATGWGWENARQAYIRIEASERSPDGDRGQHGPMVLEDTPVVSELTERFRDACLESGIGITNDHNGSSFEGFDRWETIFPHGRRRNSAEAYLAPARIRSNLKVITSAFATRITFDGNRTTGVEFERDGVSEFARCNAEVILCAGAFLSPRILMTSGIGPAEHLRSFGITPRVDSPGVGANLIDHLATRFGWANSFPGAIPAVRPDLHDPEQRRTWRRTGYGLLADNPNPCIAFTRSSEHVPHADIEILFHINPPEGLASNTELSGFEMLVAHVSPFSRGQIRLSSGDPHALPTIDPNYLSDARDASALIGGVRRALAIAQAKSLRDYSSGACQLSLDASEEEIIAWIKKHPVSMFHPVGTVRMGRRDDRDAPLDAGLRVKGVDGLRVADASAMPSTVRGHTMAPVVYIAEHGFAMIRKGI